MNVLMICQDVRVDRRIVLQAQSLSAAGYNVSILARAESSGPVPDGETDGGIPVRRIRIEGHDPRFRWLFAIAAVAGRRGYAGAVAAAKLWGAVSARNTFSVLAPPVALDAATDVYHAHDLNSLPIAYETARARAARLVYDAHEMFSEIDNPWIRVRRGYWRRTEARLLPMCRLATTVNEYIAAEMARRYGVTAPEVLYNCPRKPDDFEPNASRPFLHEALGLPLEQRIVLYQGWLGEGRGLEDLILGARHLREANAVLALMGYGESRPQLEALAREHAVGDVARFLDPVPQAALVAYCASATIGVIPYLPVDLNHFYSSPNKLFDFIQAGTPILANDLPFLRKVVVGRDIGKVAHMSGPDTVGQAMAGLLKELENPDALARLRRNLREAASVYNWEHEGEKLVGWYGERVGRPKRDA